MIPRIEDVEHPEVGRFYMVPCVQDRLLGRMDEAHHGFWPVIGSWHEDGEIVGFPDYHYHYDVRFFPGRYINRAGHGGRLFSKVCALPDAPTLVRYRKMRMRRQMPEFPTHCDNYRGELGKGMEVKFLRALEEAFKDTRLVCKTCPHRGMSLKGLPEDSEGRVVCNGHGLRWNVRTGELAPRLISRPSQGAIA